MIPDISEFVEDIKQALDEIRQGASYEMFIEDDGTGEDRIWVRVKNQGGMSPYYFDFYARTY